MDELIKNLSNLPTIGRKSAKRLAYRIIDMDPKKVDELVESIVNVKTNSTANANSVLSFSLLKLITENASSVNINPITGSAFGFIFCV